MGRDEPTNRGTNMSIPSIDSLPPAPSRDDPANFSDIADVFVAALPVFEQQTNSAISQMNIELADASANIDAALATSHFEGEWSTIGAVAWTVAERHSVSHAGIIWVLTTDVANVSASEPGITSDWTAFGISNAIIATNDEINKLSGVTTTTAQFNYLSSTTSNVQNQLDGKAPNIHSHLSADITDATEASTPNRIVKRSAAGNFSAGTITATLNGNAVTAGKLLTARSIAVGGDCSGSVSFDGSGNVTIPVVISNDSHTHISGNITDATTSNTGNRLVKRDASGNFSAGTITATLAGNASSATTAAACTGNAATATTATNANAVDGQSFSYSYSSGQNSATYVWATNVTGTSFLARRDQLSVLYAASAGTAAACTGNAATATTATKLATARTITLGTDLTGSVNFDGSGNVTLNASVVNNSHSHTSTNISDATSANTASKIVERDASGNFSAGIITASLNGNANTATSATSATSAAKWTTARTITLSGDVTGTSAAWDGSGNLAFSGTIVGNNSHTHNDSTIDGLDASAITTGTLSRNTTGNAATANWADTVDVNTSASSSLLNVVFNSGDTVYSDGGLRYRSSDNFLFVSGNVYAYYSDERLKDVTGKVENATDMVNTLDAFYYVENDVARELGYNNPDRQIGLSAQQVQKVLPEVVHLAPVDTESDEEGNMYSKTGEDYLTVDYAKVVPLLVAAIQELSAKVKFLESR